MIEAELYCYHENKLDLDFRKEEIVEGTTYQEVSVQSNAIGDTTANKAIKLATSKEILEIERRIRAINEVIEILRSQREIKLDDKDYKDKLRLLEMKYFERRYTDTAIMKELSISDRTFYRWRSEIVRLIGNRLGWRV